MREGTKNQYDRTTSFLRDKTLDPFARKIYKRVCCKVWYLVQAKNKSFRYL
jgi:hypothetical protein